MYPGRPLIILAFLATQLVDLVPAETGQPRQIQLSQRPEGVVYNPGKLVVTLTRSTLGRVSCASLCIQTRQLQCIVLTYKEADGTCTVYYDPTDPAPDTDPIQTTLTSLAAGTGGLEVWSPSADTPVSAAPTAASNTSGSLAATATGRNGTVHMVTLMATGCYRLTAVGAAGGRCVLQSGSTNSTKPGGFGARIQGYFMLNSGDQLGIAVAQSGYASYLSVSGDPGGGGGGGGSFVWLANSTGSPPQLLVAAGGGGGSSSQRLGGNASASSNGTASNGPSVDMSGSGGSNGNAGKAGTRIDELTMRGSPGAGWLTEALNSSTVAGDGGPGRTRTQNWLGGSGSLEGGFGGGGAGSSAGSAGGGGGYSGGGSGGGFTDAGGGGGSWCATAANFGGSKNCTINAGVNSAGGGSVEFTYLGASCP